MTQTPIVPGFITDATNAARSALIGRLMNPPAITHDEYRQAIKAMADSMDISEDAAERILTSDL